MFILYINNLYYRDYRERKLKQKANFLNYYNFITNLKFYISAAVFIETTYKIYMKLSNKNTYFGFFFQT